MISPVNSAIHKSDSSVWWSMNESRYQERWPRGMNKRTSVSGIHYHESGVLFHENRVRIRRPISPRLVITRVIDSTSKNTELFVR